MGNKFRLLMLTATILFLEMALIRYIPANVILTGYFSNLVLLGAFLGLGLGLGLVNKITDLSGWWSILLTGLLIIVIKLKIVVNLSASNVIFFKNIAEAQSLGLPAEVVLPILFLGVAVMFFPLGQAQGILMKKFKPLEAYAFDIGGAMLGVIGFFLASWFGVSAWIWFGIVGLLGWLVVPVRSKWLWGLGLIMMVVSVSTVYFADKDSQWSPYYKIDIGAGNDETIGKYYVVNVNNMSHQFMSDFRKREAFYFAPFDNFTSHEYKKVLIIGSGTGMDVATVLGKVPNVEEIDAVEIDPKIYAIGRELNMNKPFEDPRVKVIVDDGRHYLSSTNKKYDLIIFALTDSLAITGTSANIRLESFLFTQESFAAAKDKLSDTGLLVLYNYYRKSWLVDKIALTLQNVFGQPPLVQVYESVGNGAVFLAGPKTAELSNLASVHKWKQKTQDLVPATDDWPFIYMRNMELPGFYLEFLGIILAITVLLVLIAGKVGGFDGKWDSRMFWMGAGFMLLETKSLTTFGLLFGTTWMVNSLVFLAILVSVFLAILVNMRGGIKNIKLVYGLLGIMLVLGMVIKPSIFTAMPVVLRYIFSGIFYFSPIFLANIIFSHKYKDADDNSVQLGANMLGAVIGGIAEYASLAIGYSLLSGLILVSYGLSLL